MAFQKESGAKGDPDKYFLGPIRVRVAVSELLLSAEEARYVIGRIANRMQTSTEEVKMDEANLEHVFPKKPRRNGETPARLHLSYGISGT